MGASLGCCGGPSQDFESVTTRYRPFLDRSDVVEKSLLHKLHRSLSASWRHLREDPTLSHYYARQVDPDESDMEGQVHSVDLTASLTSGSRLLCDFYNLVLECDHSKFFIDADGRRVKGPYLKEVEIVEDYFHPLGKRARRRRGSVDAPRRPTLKTLQATDRFSNLSLISGETTVTSNDSDFWACMETFMQDEDSVSKLTRRYSFQYSGSLSDTITSMSSLKIFSPVTALHRQRSLSKQMSGDTSNLFDNYTQPTSRETYNLWDMEEPWKASPVPPSMLSSAAVAERRRTSMTFCGTTNVIPQNTLGQSGRRASMVTLASVAAS
ncbi:hypothetical protein Poli38472_003961 [Pythium oligandrum]|uniref:Uncharacterized protein n=1 Tax=Pythium oligandrum TaxID=41045 RepID=A0A8K1FKL8_PYTOL|nr:hypothetical protein Poli38472_003961 [Pythium oligandrum]|eukprot:TMW66196.1 hypothetical protein Poli38472_003961 [Pythium oligandrum]